MKIQLTSRFSSSVLFEHDAEGNTLKLTVEAAVSARAYLGGANLGGAYLVGANLGGANLVGADLVGANLDGANLDGAYLGGANLRGANLGDQWIIQGATRADGYSFFLQQLTGDSSPMVKAGCRLFTLPDAWKHWNATRGGTPLGDETIAIIDNMVALAKIRGNMK